MSPAEKDLDPEVADSPAPLLRLASGRVIMALTVVSRLCTSTGDPREASKRISDQGRVCFRLRGLARVVEKR